MLLRTITRKTSQFKQAKLPDLAYDYSELDPVFSAKTMELHHGKHHQKYVDTYNKALEDFINAKEKDDYQMQLKQAQLIAFNGGGHFNHSFFWESLAPKNKKGGVFVDKNSDFGKMMEKSFGSLDKFVEKFNEKAGGIRGSGWGWLALDPVTKNLIITETYNQDTLSQVGLKPLLNVDVWEHAFYVDYANEKPKYLKSIWEIINWQQVEKRFNEAISK